MKKSITTLFFVSLSILVFGQKIKDLEESGFNKLRISENLTIKEAKSLAQYDIDKGVVFLILQSGINPIKYETDAVFEKKFNIYFFDFGCVSSLHLFLETYNKEVFKNLDEKYGQEWRKTIRKDVVGLEEYVQSGQ